VAAVSTSFCDFRISKTPADNSAIGTVRAVAALRLDAVLSVKGVHRIEPSTEAARRHKDVKTPTRGCPRMRVWATASHAMRSAVSETSAITA